MWKIPVLKYLNNDEKYLWYVLSNVLTKKRFWDMFDLSEAMLSGSNKQ